MNRSLDNVTGRHQPVIEYVHAREVKDVIKAVEQARREGIALYPVSTGFNWGYGSASPVLPNCRLLDLSGMNRILNADDISLDNPVAVIEPGVTQGQLYDFLHRHCPALSFNVTGSSRDTSIIGNALERGVGYLGPRMDDLFGLEIVLGTGEMLRTGFRRLGKASPLAHSHPFGLGPSLDGLFFQGNFGIVTSACFRLIPRRPREVAVSLALRRSTELADFIDELARLKREGLLTSVTHLANQARTHATLSFGITQYLQTKGGLDREAALEEADRAMKIVTPHEWTSLAAISGSAGQVRATAAEIRRRIRPLARMMVVTNRLIDAGYAVAHRLRFIPFARANAAAFWAMRPFHDLALGVPTDVPIQNLLWKFGYRSEDAAELDASPCGLLYVCPALPLNGRIAAEVIEGMTSVAARHAHTLYITLNIETETSAVAVTNLLFDRGVSGEIERAHACADDLLAYIRSKGLEPYRARADMMEDIVAVNPDYWRQIRSLKTVLDPDNIIAPGRYNLAH